MSFYPKGASVAPQSCRLLGVALRVAVIMSMKYMRMPRNQHESISEAERRLDSSCCGARRRVVRGIVKRHTANREMKKIITCRVA